jgi:manganese transport protein
MSPPPAEEGTLPPLAPTLPEVFRSVALPSPRQGWRRGAAFFGPAYLVAAGYMDPGNWATGIAAGSAYGYTLLSVVLASSLMAMLLQVLAARLGIASGRDLAQLCREEYGPRTVLVLWLLCQLAIIACDLAEVIGTAIALKLLFGLPLVWGILLTAGDVMILLALQRRGIRLLEATILLLILIVAGCFAVELLLARPDVAQVAAGFMPQPELVTDSGMLYLALGIIGATVMPHNLYLHSAIVQTRHFEPNERGRREAIRFATIDSILALALAMLVNAGIVILAASVFHANGRSNVADLFEAYRLLSPMLGAAMASVLFAVALLASGQNSAVTATLAGQIVLQGFLRLRLPAWVSRLVARGLAILPAAAVTVWLGDDATARLLIFSQVVLSLQLPFAVLPLIRFTNDPRRMGAFVNPRWLRRLALAVAALLVGLSTLLVVDALR